MKKMRKILYFLFPPSSIVFLTLLGLLLKTAIINGERPIIFSEWLILMCWYFTIIALPYDLIRWLLWGKKKYFKKYESINNSPTQKHKRMTEEEIRCFALLSNHELENKHRFIQDNICDLEEYAFRERERQIFNGM